MSELEQIKARAAERTNHRIRVFRRQDVPEDGVRDLFVQLAEAEADLDRGIQIAEGRKKNNELLAADIEATNGRLMQERDMARALADKLATVVNMSGMGACGELPQPETRKAVELVRREWEARDWK